MTVAAKKKIQVLASLLVIAGLIWFLVYRTGIVSSSPDADATKKPGTSKAKAAKQLKDPTIHSELITAAEAGAEVGQKNIFQYRQKPLPPTPTQTTRPGPVLGGAAPPPPQVYAPPTPQPPPFKAFKYDGYSVMGAPKSGRAMASLTDGTNSYQVTLGECLMGQYCVRQITEKEIEIEDVQLKQRRTFPRTPSQ